jgi:hypothetical protein
MLMNFLISGCSIVWVSRFIQALSLNNAWAISALGML